VGALYIVSTTSTSTLTLEERFNRLLKFLTGIYGPNIIDDHEPPVTKPAEGFIKDDGKGWGANQDPDTWSITKMTKFPNLFKIVDSEGINVATDFTSEITAQAFIDWSQSTDNDDQPTDDNEPDIPSVPEEPTTAGESITKDGIKVPFEIEGNWDYTVKEDWRDGGARFNMICPGTSVVIVGAFTGTGGSDERSPKLLMGRHTDNKGNNEHYMGCGYDGGIPIKGGFPRLRLEGPHNKYTSALKKFITRKEAKSCINQWVLNMAAAIQEEKGVRFLIYEAKSIQSGDKPISDWEVIYEYLDDGTEAKELTGKDGLDLKHFPIRNLDHTKGTAQSVWRVDATPGLKQKWLAVAKVKANTNIKNV